MDKRDAQEAQHNEGDEDDNNGDSGNEDGSDGEPLPHSFRPGPLPPYISTVLLHRPLPWDRCIRA